jgi:hypothetical protein
MSEIDFEDRVVMTQVIIHILDTWGLADGQQLGVLGLEDTPKRAVRKFRDHTPLPETEAVMERVEHVAGIAEALRTTYPRNAHMGPRWMQEGNRRFDGRSPAQTIVEDGLSGLIAVRAHLDCAFAWEKSEAQAT